MFNLLAGCGLDNHAQDKISGIAIREFRSRHGLQGMFSRKSQYLVICPGMGRIGLQYLKEFPVLMIVQTAGMVQEHAYGDDLFSRNESGGSQRLIVSVCRRTPFSIKHQTREAVNVFVMLARRIWS